MTKTFKARVSHGLLEPMEKIDLPEGLEITITISASISASKIEKAAGKKTSGISPLFPIRNRKKLRIF